MKSKLKQWLFRLLATMLFIIGLLLLLLLHPAFSYANKTSYKNYFIFHNTKLDSSVFSSLDKATKLIEKSDYYNPRLHLQICLHDGSLYPEWMKALRGQAFAWGWYNKVVLMGNADYKNNVIELNGYKWNAAQLLAHEMTHCLQFDKLGLLKSNPIAKIADWKWEGYPEYIARQEADEKDVSKDITRLLAVEQTNNNGWIQFSDGTGTVIQYYKYWLLVTYCIDIKRMTYTQLLKDTTSEKIVQKQMLNWYWQKK